MLSQVIVKSEGFYSTGSDIPSENTVVFTRSQLKKKKKTTLLDIVTLDISYHIQYFGAQNWYCFSKGFYIVDLIYIILCSR